MPAINVLITAASNGDTVALAQLLALAFSANAFIARRVRRELREKFNINAN